MEIIDSEPEIDFNHLNQYVGGDILLTKEVFGLFKNQVDIWAKALSADVDDSIWSGLTHSLKGSARAIGANRLADVCEKTENLIGENARRAAREVAVDEIEHRIARTMIEIQRWEYNQRRKDMRKE